MTVQTPLLLTSKLTRPLCYPLSPPLTSAKDQTSQSYSFSIEQALQIYGSQPELLGLVLYSKLEEDRRKTEEAKLRQKEIEYILQKQQIIFSRRPAPTLPSPFLKDELATKSTLDRRPSTAPKETVLYPERPSDLKRKMSFDMPSLPLSPPLEISKKRKRTIQAITTMIETKEFPYRDDYLWKNNGNTTHRKSGLRSVYYKCSNGAKGCPVNKTVTFKKKGEYLIKYRGEHLKECSRVKRITDL
ncbi:hypothetical protein BY458DRAFT_528702 [Sporodiniella umbellata]|nr:hypothetical protein BY458DRAFT_528702 [Sporodiniella umbellata]